MSDEVRDRLLKAWRGEIEAGRVYELISRRMPEREGDILRRMSAAEASHRERLEARMHDLDIPIPDQSSVTLSPWLRLQARVAPIDRLLAAREAAEDEEVDDLYKRSTGDQVTDRLLRDIRKEERSHSLAVQEMRDGSDPSPDPAPVGVPGAQRRLDKILGREKWHSSSTSWISGAIYGANDGLAAVFGIVAGVSGATGGSTFVLTAGLSGAVASALSMATGAFLAERSEHEMMEANIERERQEIAEHPEEEKEELSLFYQLKGIPEKTADELAERLSQHPDAMLQALAAEEFGSTGDTGNPVQASIAAGISTGIGGIVPVIPFIFATGTVAIAAAAIVSLVAHFLVGAAKSLVTLRSWWSAGFEMTLAGVIVGGAMYGIGQLFPT
ncbi:MAG TPA: VIT1/CCC1 transporter family protein [Solirubrobacteraceae bacterium]|nr:VIT1/CCC1 transporter family protein [Solirubrobacteraceae bacterium]